MKRLFTNRWVHFLLLVTLLALSVVSGADRDFRQRIRFAVFDTYQNLKPRPYMGDVVIVDYDDESLKIVGQWPWPRNVIATIVDNLTFLGAKSIAFDGVLAEPDRSSPRRVVENLESLDPALMKNFQNSELPDTDQILANSIKNSKIFVTAFSHGSNPSPPRIFKDILGNQKTKDHFLKWAQSFVNGSAQFLPILQEGAVGNGSFIALPEIDGLIRRVNLIFSDGEQLYPGLSLEAIRVAEGDLKTVYTIGPNKEAALKPASNYRIVFSGHAAPIDERGSFWVYYKTHNPKEDYLPAYKLLDKKYFDEIAPMVRDKIILIGSSAEGLKDLRAAPVNGFLPGVEIHANVIEQILNKQFLFRPSDADISEDGFILLVGSLLIIFAPLIGAVWLGLISFAIIASCFYASWNLFVLQGALFDPLYPSLCIFIIFSLSTLLTYIRAESQRKHIRQAFGLYISPDFMKELTRDPGMLKLGGQTKDLTVMFSDIRNFTTISESLSPEALIQLMNDFLTPMSDLVMKNRGTIDKYMGDAMMAFWNAPLDDPDHARHACIAALGMQSALEPINAQVKSRAEQEGRTPVLLKAGIGLNTGSCAVGNMGSRQRFAYSILGDAVNLASRLEGQTKTYGVGILLGEKTAQAVDDFAILEADLIKVKGKTKAERIFILLGDMTLAAQKDFRALRTAHEEFINAYRDGRFSEAENCLQKCRAAQVYNLDAFYDLYLERLSELKSSPPPKDSWTGIFEAKTK